MMTRPTPVETRIIFLKVTVYDSSIRDSGSGFQVRHWDLHDGSTITTVTKSQKMVLTSAW